MSDPVLAWLAAQRDLMERWQSARPANDGGAPDTEAVHREMQRWWQAIAEHTSPQAQALAQQMAQLGPSFLAGTGDTLFDLFGATNDSSSSGSGPNEAKFERWLDLAPIGYFREHQARAQDLTRALDDYRRIATQMSTAIAHVHADALELLAQKTQALEAAGDTVNDTHRLYNLWIESGEQAFSQQARGDVFGRLQGELVNAGVRVRSAQQAIAEYFLKSLDLPTRAELNSVHRRLKEMRERVERLELDVQQRAVLQPAPVVLKTKRGTKG